MIQERLTTQFLHVFNAMVEKRTGRTLKFFLGTFAFSYIPFMQNQRRFCTND